MLEQKTEIDISKGWIIEKNESCIDIDEEVYLITWSPDPIELPDSDFYLQHNVNVKILADYLKFCKTGLFCVESTQMGNPHYHGWYQIDPDKEIMRICLIKTMNRFGIIKITPARSIKINRYSKHSNALYYYKKDVFGSMATITPNPITRKTVSTVNFEVLPMIDFMSNMNKRKQIPDRLSDLKFYEEFYKDTIGYLKS
jgi:hypothetical protein